MMNTCRKIDFGSVRANTGNLCLDGDLLLCECGPVEDMDVAAVLDGISIIGICLEGHAIFEIGYRRHDVYRGIILVLFPGESFRLSEASTNLDIKFIVFKEDFMRWKGEVLDTVGFSDGTGKMHLLPISDESMQKCIATYGTIRKRLECRQHKSLHNVVMLYLQILIYDIYDSSAEYRESVTHDGQGGMRNIFEHFLTLVSEQYREHPNVAYYADRLCVSPKHLSRTVYSASGRHASEWIANARIIDAKICLRMTELSLADISAKLNFSSPSHFGRFFKHYTGMTPKEYRDL